MNGLLITRGRIPPLIVTLGSFSLYRGLAEGMTGGVDNFTHFPESFLFLGQGYLLGGIPAQLPIFVAVAAAFWLLLHRTTIGRGLVAIGFSPEGARYAGLPVGRLLALAYVLSGLVASLAAVIYVAHLGQAKADAGTGYELAAITAVVLGRDFNLRRPRQHPRHPARPAGDRRDAERSPPGRPARRAGWRLDRNASTRCDRIGSSLGQRSSAQSSTLRSF